MSPAHRSLEEHWQQRERIPAAGSWNRSQTEPKISSRAISWLGADTSLGLLCLLLWATLALHLADLWRLQRDAPFAAHLAEGGPFQNLQLTLLAWALLLCGFTARSNRGHERSVMVYLLAPCFYLFWREADWDKDVLSLHLGQEGIRMFSWRYLGTASESPLILKLVFGVVSIRLVAAWAVVGTTMFH